MARQIGSMLGPGAVRRRAPLVLRTDLMARLSERREKPVEWQRIVDDLADLSEIDIEQDGRRLKSESAEVGSWVTSPTISAASSPICARRP